MAAFDLMSSMGGMFNFGGTIGTVINIGMVILLAGIALMIGLFIMNILSFNIKVTIFDFAGGETKKKVVDGKEVTSTQYFSGLIKEDKARAIKSKEGIEELKLFSAGFKMPMPPRKAFSFKKSMFGMGYALFLQKFSNTDYRPLVFSENPGTYEAISPNMQVWNVLAHRRNREQFYKQDFLAKYGHYIAWGATIAISCLVLMFLFREIKGLTGSIASLAESVRSTMVTTPRVAP